VYKTYRQINLQLENLHSYGKQLRDLSPDKSQNNNNSLGFKLENRLIIL